MALEKTRKASSSSCLRDLTPPDSMRSLCDKSDAMPVPGSSENPILIGDEGKVGNNTVAKTSTGSFNDDVVNNDGSAVGR